MSMRGLGLDGAKKLQAALKAYINDHGAYGFDTAKAYGKGTKVAKLIDEITAYTVQLGNSWNATVSNYINQTNQIIQKYQSFDNTGANSLGKIIPSNKKS